MRSIVIGGHRYQIVRVKDMEDMDSDGAEGQCSNSKKTIRIDKSLSGEAYRTTLAHEIVHAALFVGGLNEVLGDATEEAVVRCMENLVYPAWNKVYREEIGEDGARGHQSSESE